MYRGHQLHSKEIVLVITNRHFFVFSKLSIPFKNVYLSKIELDKVNFWMLLLLYGKMVHLDLF